MADNLTGNNLTAVGESTASNRTDWRPTDNGGLSQGASGGLSRGQSSGFSQDRALLPAPAITRRRLPV
jgi:hypothetical protein